MNVIILTDEAMNFMKDWLKKKNIALHYPPPVLDSYEVIVKGSASNIPFYRAEYKGYDACEKYSDPSREWNITTILAGKPFSFTLGLHKDGSAHASGGINSWIINPYSLSYPADDDKFCIAKLVALTHSLCMHFLANFSPELHEYTDKQVNITRKKPNSKPKKQVYTRIAIWKYVKDIRSGVMRLPRNKCDFCFGVRGHYRHYKSGKIVFIHAYEKNKDKPQRKDTQYILPELKVAKG